MRHFLKGALTAGGIDLSVGPVAALTATLAAAMMVGGVPIPLALPGALAVGAACGFVNGTLIGCIILGTLRNGLTLLNVQAFDQLLATGIIIIIAMLIDKFASGAGDGTQG